MIKHTAEKYAAIFQQTDGDPRAVQNGVNGYRVKTIRAGDTLEIEGYAIWSTQRTAAEARKQTERHRELVRAVHLRNRQKAMRRLINANFGDGDILLTLTYGWGSQPQDEKQAGRDVKNFLKRLRRKRARLGLEDLKYIYTTEVTHGTAVRYHHHLIVNGGIPREEIEALWTSGLINSRIARTDATGWRAGRITWSSRRPRRRKQADAGRGVRQSVRGGRSSVSSRCSRWRAGRPCRSLPW